MQPTELLIMLKQFDINLASSTERYISAKSGKQFWMRLTTMLAILLILVTAISLYYFHIHKQNHPHPSPPYPMEPTTKSLIPTSSIYGQKLTTPIANWWTQATQLYLTRHSIIEWISRLHLKFSRPLRYNQPIPCFSRPFLTNHQPFFYRFLHNNHLHSSHVLPYMRRLLTLFVTSLSPCITGYLTISILSIIISIHQLNNNILQSEKVYSPSWKNNIFSLEKVYSLSRISLFSSSYHVVFSSISISIISCIPILITTI